jgi:hypothetical protein
MRPEARHAGLFLLSLACSSSVRDAPTGEVLVVVDGEIPVPTFVSRPRVDTYEDGGGAGTGTHEASLARKEDWPTSFGVSAAPPTEPTGEPRLVDHAGNDVTPATEPQPLVTIDRALPSG